MSNEHRNPYIKELETDYLYHLGLDSSMNLPEMFGDVKYVCMGGSPVRAKDFAVKAAEEFGITDEPQVIGKTERCTLYKVGPVISISHGMGMPSMSIFLNEVTKLLEHAGATGYSFIRIGTSGGVGVDAGDVVITDKGLNEMLEPKHEKIVLSQKREYDTTLDKDLSQRIAAAAGDIRVRIGNTVGTNDFYLGQGRLDGALNPGYTEADKMAWLEKVLAAGGLNIEMEAPEFAAFCLEAKIPGAIVCAALLNRMEGDQIRSTPAQLGEFSDRAQKVVLRFIRADLARLRGEIDSTRT